jgi:DNA mismatch repair protein MutS2
MSEYGHSGELESSVSGGVPFMKSGHRSLSELERVSLQELEYPKVLAVVARYAMSDRAKDAIAEILPFSDAEELRKELRAVRDMLGLLRGAETLPLEHTEDISSHLSRSVISGSALSAPQITDVLDVLQITRRCSSHLRARAEAVPALALLVENISEHRLLEKHISDAIDETGAVRDTASRELRDIRQEIVRTSARLRQRLTKLLGKLNDEDLLQDEYITQRDGRFVVPLKTTNKRALPGIIHGVSQSGSTVFLEPAEVFELNNELSLLHNAEQREVLRILTTLTAEIGSVAHEIRINQEVLTHLDCVFAKASYADAFRGIEPVIVDDGECELKNAVHPLLAHSLPRASVVPLSVRFDRTTLGYLVSGPNAGGKSVALKSIGLNIAMAVSGIFPLGECVTKLCTFLVSIGDHQSIESNLSTFSSQILRLKHIVDVADSHSLILVDEICSGTDPAEGSALACGIIDEFLRTHARFIVTTHQSSLKSYALQREGIANASMEFDSQKLIPTYRFLPGIPGNSYAFELARSVSLSATVLEKAMEYLGDKHGNLEKSIAKLQDFVRETEQRLASAREAEQKAIAKNREYEERFSSFAKKYRELMRAANEEAAEVIRSASAQVERAVREAREQTREPKDIRADLEQLRADLAKKLEKERVQQRKDNRTFSVGDTVRLESSNQSGVVVKVQDDAALVEFNGIQFRVKQSELVHTQDAPKRFRSGSGFASSSPAFSKASVSATADLRGMRAGEAIAKLDTQISDAIVANIPYLTVIHGKGTGALRQAVHEFLRDHPSVANYRIGAQGEGDAGVTQVELR